MKLCLLLATLTLVLFCLQLGIQHLEYFDVQTGANQQPLIMLDLLLEPPTKVLDFYLDLEGPCLIISP